MKIAIVGTGIAGLSAAWLLNQNHDITVYEAADRLGGHANTVEIPPHPAVDTGFIVFNERTYPNFLGLLKHLGVAFEKSDMSFGVSLDDGRFEYASSALFAKAGLLFSPSYWRLLFEIPRFHKTARAWLQTTPEDNKMPLGKFLVSNGFSKDLVAKHIVPMGGSIWSTDAANMLDFPARFFLQFMENHGLLSVSEQPQWYTVSGGSKTYVEKLAAPFRHKIILNAAVRSILRESSCARVELADGRFDKFDHVVLATHSDQALGLVADATPQETKVLSGIPYSSNFAVLHQDPSFMPKRRKAWSSWNYLSSHHGKINLTYWMNKLQPFLPYEHELFVTLNPTIPPQGNTEIARISYAHPQYTAASLETHEQLYTIQGKARLWFCGAWCGYGFHEDGLLSGLTVAEALGSARRPWPVATEMSCAGKTCRPLP